jgi:hypothetical protein
MKRLSDRYVWGELDETEHRSQRRDLESRLAVLPPPSASYTTAFDRAATTLLPMADTTRNAMPEHQCAIIRHVVEKAVIADGEVIALYVRAEAKPLVDDFPAAVVMAPPDGLERPAATQRP